ncbi:MAG TPA: hypothetical protein VL728_18115 [Cyclobacteriaceae bacterium]|jgi:hypothetical protein|nr:hypothetical protein [Cyclobacteriaceae bacterium]
MSALLKRQAIGLLLSVIVIFTTNSGGAQPGNGNGGGHGKPCANPPCNRVPFSGLGVLITAGIIFGIWKISQRAKSAE